MRDCPICKRSPTRCSCDNWQQYEPVQIIQWNTGKEVESFYDACQRIKNKVDVDQ